VGGAPVRGKPVPVPVKAAAKRPTVQRAKRARAA
jgi:hypothetical protein